MAARKGTYPKADAHIRESGLRVSELATLASLAEKSILRVRKGEVVLETTIRRMVNALNKAYFNRDNGQSPLEFDREFFPN